MRARRLALVALAALGVAAAASAHDATLEPIVPAIVAYRWHLLVPHWVVEPRVVRAPASLAWDARQVDYALPEFDWTSRRIGALPHFECKYVDFWLPNTCTTTWRDVYVDVPVAVVRHDRIDVDVPRITRPGDAIDVDVPRLEWKEATLDVSLPALAAPACAAPNADRRCPR